MSASQESCRTRRIASRCGYSRSRCHGLAVAALIAAMAIAVRLPMSGFESGDYRYFLEPWSQFIDSNGGFAALDKDFANYNVPYLYILAALTYLPVPTLVGVKAVSVLFDLLLAFFVHRLVALRHPDGWPAPAAAAVVLLLPTVAVNSAMWAQCDSIYAAFGLGGLYAAIKSRPRLCGVFFGLALAFKLQIVFIAPVLLVLLLLRRVTWTDLMFIPGVVLALDVPALLAGADLGRLLSVYTDQAGEYDALTLNAPTVYRFLDFPEHADILRLQGIAVTGALVLWVALVLAARAVPLDRLQLVLLATTFAILVPFFLPAMHERYFYLADVLTVVAAFWIPRLWIAAVLVQFASLCSYVPFLRETWGDAPADWRLLALAMAAAGVLVARELGGNLAATAANQVSTAGPDSGDRRNADWQRI